MKDRSHRNRGWRGCRLGVAAASFRDGRYAPPQDEADQALCGLRKNAKRSRTPQGQCIALPPSTLIVCPVMKSLAAQDRNMTAPVASVAIALISFLHLL